MIDLSNFIVYHRKSSNFVNLYLAIALFATGCQLPENATQSTSTENEAYKIDSIAARYIDEGKVMGFSIAVMKGDQITYNNSFGYVDSIRRVPTTNNHLFLMASISKLVGATMVMKLVEEGKLNLEDKLIDVLPDFPNPLQAQKIKVKHLISMTSGLAEYAPKIDSIFLSTGQAPSKQDYYDFFGNQTLEYEPGTYYKYVNSGFVLMAMIVEMVTGSTFADELDRIINQPAGFHIKLISDRLNDPRLSSYFNLEHDLLVFRPHWPWIKGDGGMTATASELVQFPKYWKDGTWISQKSFEQMISPTKLEAGIVSEYGFGTKNGDFEGEPMYGHSGGNLTTFSMMFHFPKLETTLVVLVNTNKTSSHARNIFSDVASIVLGKDRPDFTGKIIDTDEEVNNYVGTYASPGDEPIAIFLDDNNGSLYYGINQDASNAEKMVALSKGEYWIAKWPFDRVRFVKNEKGNVVALKEFYSGYMHALRKKVE